LGEKPLQESKRGGGVFYLESRMVVAFFSEKGKKNGRDTSARERGRKRHLNSSEAENIRRSFLTWLSKGGGTSRNFIKKERYK